MKRSIAFAALALASCHHGTSTPAAPAVSTAETDALWALAPAGATAGVVVAPPGLAMIEGAWQDVRAYLRSSPELAEGEASIASALDRLGLPRDAHLADLGISSDHGAALFVVGDGKQAIAILPVADRERFLARTHGTHGAHGDVVAGATCRTIAGGRYACASAPALFDALGKGGLRAHLDAVHARGEIEGVFAGGSIQVAAVGQLARGRATWRGIVEGVPANVTGMLGAGSKPALDLEHTAGFASIDVRPFLKEVPAMPLVAGVTLADLAQSLGGPLTITVGNGHPVVTAHLPLVDPGPFQRLIAHCTELPMASTIGVTQAGDVCRVPVPKMQATLELAVRGKELQIGTPAGAGPVSVPPTELEQELARDPWSIVLWGRGTILAPMEPALAIPWGRMGPKLGFAARLGAQLDELGLAVRVEGNAVRFVFAVRTLWANPDDVVAKVQAIDPARAVLDPRATDAARVAAAAPGSPFAADFRAGYGGMMMPTATIGAVAAIAVPAFLEYMKKSKQNAAELELNVLGKHAKAYYAEHGSFPVGDAPATPALATCCGQKNGDGEVDNKCPADLDAWTKNPVWAELGFAVDERTPYRFTYHSSDGKSFDATAIADLDCDGNFATYELNGGITADGNPALVITVPPRGTY